ncbi:MAG: hypothetical protein J6M06_02560 [Synergistaceae bacterium]|nr:hypothetical protein [Synergistaceae bacterium]
MKETISIEFDDEKLRALEMVLKKEHSSVPRHLSRALDELYERKVPEPVREFIDSKAAAKTKRSPRPAPKPTAEPELEVHHEQ